MLHVSNAALRHTRYILPTAHANAVRYASFRQLLLSVSVYSAVRQAESLHCASRERIGNALLKFIALICPNFY